MNLKRNKREPIITFSGLLILVMIGCGGTLQTTKQSAIETLERSIDPAANATISTSTDVDRNVGVLAWDKFTLPVFSANGLHVAVQLGSIPSINTLVGKNNRPVESTTIELHFLDPLLGKQISRLVTNQSGLLLSRCANDQVVFIESPRGDEGRWIGEVEWSTGIVEWIVRDDAINAFPTTNTRGDLAWSTHSQDENRFHLEGETYLWRDAEFVEVLKNAGLGADVKLARAVYGLNKGTNFRDPHHPEEPPSNVLHFVDHPGDLAASHGLSVPDFNAKIDAIDAALLKVRDTRDQPLTDDKVITAWNGLMITGFADAARVLQNDQWVERAQQAADFILTQMRNQKGMLLRTWRDGKGGGEAFLVDYAAMIRGLLAIYSANQNPEPLESAIKLYDQARSLFFVEGRGWYDTQEGQSDLFVRTRALSDGALPAATSLILADLVSLSEITNDPRFKSDAMKSLNSESQLLDRAPTAAVVATQAFNKLHSVHPDLFADSTDSKTTSSSPVHMTCSPTSMQLVVGESAELTIQLAMTKNWHVNSNAPGNEYAIPLSFKVLNDNISIEPSWPVSIQMMSAGESVQVYSHNVSIPIVVRANDGAKGPIQLMVTWQACDAESCLEQETMQVPCAITVK